MIEHKFWGAVTLGHAFAFYRSYKYLLMLYCLIPKPDAPTKPKQSQYVAQSQMSKFRHSRRKGDTLFSQNLCSCCSMFLSLSHCFKGDQTCLPSLVLSAPPALLHSTCTSPNVASTCIGHILTSFKDIFNWQTSFCRLKGLCQLH